MTTTLYLDRLARVYGNIRGLNMYGDLIPVSWATVAAYGPILATTSSLDGFYEMWIVNGTYTLGVSSPGYGGQQAEIGVSVGWETPADFDLGLQGGTIPELSAAGLTLLVVLVIVYALLYRKESLSDSSLRRPPVAKGGREQAKRT